MAPTLLGYHRELACPNCEFRFDVGLDEEGRAGPAGLPELRPADLDASPAVECSGDRVLVQKFLYDFRPPERWEVAVFHYPGRPVAGVRQAGGRPARRVDPDRRRRRLRSTARSPARRSTSSGAMRILVHDNDFVPRDRDRFPRWVVPPRRRADAARQRLAGRADRGSSTRPAGPAAGPRSTGSMYRHWDPDRGRYAPSATSTPTTAATPRRERGHRPDARGPGRRRTADVEALAVRLRLGRATGSWSGSRSARRGRSRSRRNGAAAVADRRWRNPLRRRERPAADVTARGVGDRPPAHGRARRRARCSSPIDYDDPAAGPGADDESRSRSGVRGRRAGRSATCGSIATSITPATLASTPRRPFGVDRAVPARAGRILRPGRQQPGLERLAVLGREPGRAAVDVPGQAVPGPPARARSCRSRSSAGRFTGFPIPGEIRYIRLDRGRSRDRERRHGAGRSEPGEPIVIEQPGHHGTDRRRRPPPTAAKPSTAPEVAREHRTPGGPPRDGRGDRRRVHPRAGGPRLRGRGVRDPDRLDGPDPDGPAQGGHLPAVRLRLRGQRLGGGRGPRRHAAAGSTPGSASTAGSRHAARRRAELQGGPHPGDDVPLRPARSCPGASPPERWDVVVFRYPEEPEVSYIKRLVGLPGETIRIYHGDIYIKPPGGTRLHARSASRSSTSAAMQITVYDDRHRPQAPGRTSPNGRGGSPSGRRLEGRRAGRRVAYRCERRRRTTGPSCATATSSPTPSSGTPSSNDRTAAPAPAADARSPTSTRTTPT